jgi:hypothetical protein
MLHCVVVCNIGIAHQNYSAVMMRHIVIRTVMRSGTMLGDNTGALVAEVPIVRFGGVRDEAAPRVAMPRLRLKTITEQYCLCQCAMSQQYV